ncbi:hypothetical protein [Rubinisphaera margarita]|uniref:hypothetical protein n=1 Tax=Rubinisphaera margarita TaxID=2909586 RepID=UPI001EE95403|nr:hypothetical protein [Rubinisphaera margarita]MCG6155194.1 hypothetical protein [Rubinisphaera margarita]
MSNHEVIIEWDLPHLKLLSASTSGGTTSIQHWAKLDLPQQIAESTSVGKDAADWLQHHGPEWLRTSGDNEHAMQISIVLPRDRMTIRKLEVPPMPVDELPGVIPLQIASQLSARPDDLVIDFLPGLRASSGEDGGQAALAAALPRDQMDQLQKLATGLHGDLVSVGVSSVALWEAIARAHEPLLTSVVSICTEERIETLLTSEKQLTASGSRRRNHEQPFQGREAVAEIRRLLAAEEAETRPVQLVNLTSRNDRELVTEMRSAADWNVEVLTFEEIDSRIRIDEACAPETAAGLYTAGAMPAMGGLLARHGAQTAQLDLVHPRRLKETRDYSRIRKIGLISVCCLALIGAYLGWWWKLSSLQAEVEGVNDKVVEVEKFLRDQGKLVKHAETLNQYRRRSLDVGDHFQQILADLPQRDQLLLTSWQSIPLTGASHTRIVSGGIAKSRQAVESFAERLAAAGWIVRSPVIRTADSGQFTYEFDLDCEIPVERRTAASASPRVRVTPTATTTGGAR